MCCRTSRSPSTPNHLHMLPHSTLNPAQLLCSQILLSPHEPSPLTRDRNPFLPWVPPLNTSRASNMRGVIVCLAALAYASIIAVHTASGVLTKDTNTCPPLQLFCLSSCFVPCAYNEHHRSLTPAKDGDDSVLAPITNETVRYLAAAHSKM